ncbi:MAG: hypothetical protein IJ429_02655 [Lachnospiraceae bacterium]|nr:hypothetical protein [Lachnospiraceae bacterium]
MDNLKQKRKRSEEESTSVLNFQRTSCFRMADSLGGMNGGQIEDGF